jgi:hypothetical protein
VTNQREDSDGVYFDRSTHVRLPNPRRRPYSSYGTPTIPNIAKSAERSTRLRSTESQNTGQARSIVSYRLELRRVALEISQRTAGVVVAAHLLEYFHVDALLGVEEGGGEHELRKTEAGKLNSSMCAVR